MEITGPTLNEAQAASYLGLSRKTLQKYRFERREPSYLKLGRAVRYRRADLDAFLDKHLVQLGAQF